MALEVRGLINIQFAVKDDEIFVLEANPRASRTVPFVAKATGVPIARIGAKLSFEAADGGGGTRTRIVFEKTGLAPMDNA